MPGPFASPPSRGYHAGSCWASNPDGPDSRPANHIGLQGSAVELSPTLVQGRRTFGWTPAARTPAVWQRTASIAGAITVGAVGVYEGNTQLPVRVTGQP
jgi:hypothetical protein